MTRRKLNPPETNLERYNRLCEIMGLEAQAKLDENEISADVNWQHRENVYSSNLLLEELIKHHGNMHSLPVMAKD
jgi:hypothetical protein